MAHDIDQNKDVALKIMISGEEAEYKLSMQDEIMRTVQDTSSLLTYEKTFVIPGYYDNHRFQSEVRVSAPVCRICHLTARISAAGQLLKALKCLHDGGIVHRGEST